MEAKIWQITKSTTELLIAQILRKSAAATVTGATAVKADPNSPASLAVSGTSATGVTATAEGTDGDILDEESWNVISGTWKLTEIPEGRFREQQGGIIALKLSTAPAASMSVGAIVKFREYR